MKELLAHILHGERKRSKHPTLVLANDDSGKEARIASCYYYYNVSFILKIPASKAVHPASS